MPAYAPLALPKRYPQILHVEGTQAFAANTVGNPIAIDKNGFLQGLMLSVAGTVVTGATAPVNNNSSPYQLLKRIQLAVSGGVGRSIDCSGYELNVAERTREQDYLDAPVTPTTASTTNNWTFDLFVPVALRSGEIYTGYSDLLGGIYTGDSETSCTLRLTYGSGADIFTNNAAANPTLAFTVTVVSFKLDTPRPDQDPDLLAAISWVHNLIEETSDTTITATGNAGPYKLPTAETRTYLRVWALYGDGNAPNFTWKFGVVDTIDINLQDYIHFWDQVPEQAIKALQLRRYENQLPAGSYVADFAASMYRNQWLPVENVSLFKVVPHVTAPGAGAVLNIMQESLTPSPLAAKFMRAAGGSAAKAA